jgi:iron complex outermembrane recepter protein
MTKSQWLTSSMAIFAVAGAASSAFGQVAPAASSAPDTASAALAGEVVVTARKRSETLQSAPISMTAFNQKFLQTYQIHDIKTIAAFTPGLVVGDSNTGIGGTIYLRGVGATADSPLVDSAVSLNLDGVQIGPQALRSAMLDLGQVEVLRGPQALFFGMNSPGGVVSLQSAKPTDQPYIKAETGYEFSAAEKYGEVVVSGPITNNLKGRAAIYYSDMDGYWKLISAAVPGVSPAIHNDRAPDASDFIGKGSVVYDPGNRFDLTANFSYSHYNSDDGVTLQRIRCPAGHAQLLDPQFIPLEDCKVNDTVVTGAFPQSVLDADPKATKGQPLGYVIDTQYLADVTANYRLSDNLVLTSVTGYYDANDQSSTNFSIEPDLITGDAPWIHLQQFSEELRLASKFDGPINFLTGGYFQRARTVGDFQLFAPSLLEEVSTQRRTVWSGFVESIFTPIKQVEITAGVRYTNDDKNAQFKSSAIPGAVVDKNPVFNNLSPEVTVKYQPSQGLNFYASYKQGFQSGGLNSGTSVVTNLIASGGTLNVVYGSETVEGVEGGVKWTSADSRLRATIAAFDYLYKGLQLQSTDPNSNFTILIQNVGAARNQGFEGDVNWRPEYIDGLTLFGSASYLHARYANFIGDCYGGQSVSQGCDLQPNPSGQFTKQNLDGKQLKSAPDWTATYGGQYNLPLTSDYRLEVAASGTYSSSYIPDATADPQNVQKAFAELNAAITLVKQNGRYRIALIGENLTNVFVITDANKDFISGSQPAGTATAFKEDQFGNVNRGREVRIQFTFEM